MTDSNVLITEKSSVSPRENGKFKKGYSGNPRGLIKGTYPKVTQEFIKLKEMAADYGPKALDMLKQAMEDNKSWAYDIYFKELFHVPKNYGEKTVILEKTERSLEGQIKVLTETLPEFDEVTHTEHLERLKVLNGVKNGVAIEVIATPIRESTESLKEKVEMIQKIIEFKKGEGT